MALFLGWNADTNSLQQRAADRAPLVWTGVQTALLGDRHPLHGCVAGMVGVAGSMRCVLRRDRYNYGYTDLA
jgi:hypothetical protein